MYLYMDSHLSTFNYLSHNQLKIFNTVTVAIASWIMLFNNSIHSIIIYLSNKNNSDKSVNCSSSYICIS